MRKAAIFFPTALATSANFITNFKALETLNVSTLAVMHNVNLLLVACFDAVFFGRKFNPSTMVSLLIIMAGAIMYCYGEIQVSVVGYIWIFLHLIAHESQSLYTKYVTVIESFTAYEMSLYNALWSCPILLATVIFSGDFNQAISDLMIGPLFWVIASGICAMLLSNLRFYTLKSLSVTAYAALNIVNKVPASIIGAFLFNQVVTPIQIIGYVLAFAGSYIYSVFSRKDTFDESAAIIKRPIPVVSAVHTTESSDTDTKESV